MKSNNIVLAMQTELNLTEKDLIELEKEKAGLVFDVKTDSGFKAAKKERQERNKINGNIDRLAIDGKKAIDEIRVTLKDRVEAAYTNIVQPFEVEDAERKRIAAEAKEKEQARVDAIQDRINLMRSFVDTAKGLDIDGISGLIEAVDLIDCADNFDEFAGDALTVQRDVLSDLNIKLKQAIAEDDLAKQKAEMDAKQAEMEQREKEYNDRIAAFEAKEQEQRDREKAAEHEKQIAEQKEKDRLLAQQEREDQIATHNESATKINADPELTNEQPQEEKQLDFVDPFDDFNYQDDHEGEEIKMLSDYDRGFIDGINSFDKSLTAEQNINAYLDGKNET